MENINYFQAEPEIPEIKTELKPKRNKWFFIITGILVLALIILLIQKPKGIKKVMTPKKKLKTIKTVIVKDADKTTTTTEVENDDSDDNYSDIEPTDIPDDKQPTV